MFCVAATKPDGTIRYYGHDGGKSAHIEKIRPFPKERNAQRFADRLKRKNPLWRIEVGPLKKENPSDLSWTPFQQVEETEDGDPIYANNRYVVIVHPLKGPDVWPDMVHLSIRHVERLAVHDWRDFQRIKNELVGEECEAVELYPAESRLVDSANQYHLWVFKNPKHRYPFGFQSRLVVDEVPDDSGAKQRKF